MSYFDSFDCQVQYEEFCSQENMVIIPDTFDWIAVLEKEDALARKHSEDIMDRCEVASLEHLQEDVDTYNMEGIIVEELAADDYYDDYERNKEDRARAMSWKHRDAILYKGVW